MKMIGISVSDPRLIPCRHHHRHQHWIPWHLSLHNTIWLQLPSIYYHWNIKEKNVSFNLKHASLLEESAVPNQTGTEKKRNRVNI